LILSHPSGVFIYNNKKRVLQGKKKQKKTILNFKKLSEFIPKESIPDPSNVDLWLKVNDTFRQQGNTKDMIFRLDQ
jgi:2-keto-4-pentenoate hydratase/2-oxohepta-3-ene-1,7-dioic acid hydratase in catechol pathway